MDQLKFYCQSSEILTSEVNWNAELVGENCACKKWTQKLVLLQHCTFDIRQQYTISAYLRDAHWFVRQIPVIRFATEIIPDFQNCMIDIFLFAMEMQH